MSRPLCARLPVTVDLPLLLAALDEIGEDDWQPHFNQHYYAGDWSGVALIAAVDAPVALGHGAGAALSSAPWLRDARWQQGLQGLALDIRSARLLRLGPGAQIHEHRDYDLDGEDADLRLHIPLLSPPQVDFMLDGQRIPMAAGECWFLDLCRRHSVHNRDRSARIHLVVDCRPGPWIMQTIAAGLPTTPAPGRGQAGQAFAQFQQWLLQQPQACAELQALQDVEAFIQRTLAMAAAQGLEFDREHLRAAMRAGRARWSDQWKV
ncbi:aspartyl/asparaginyl beta-hydroxylase domain-containing protein [Pseudomonas sp. MAFF212428]|uniref:Aspartyl/asparaginyl beta-hydroxylase domain-containing protein n=1 Tax=Pseudomonas brassicae TaxID=2708063 RepID=A0A6B3NM95_9PSED|nr:aspartyl/asparaginyl beta-hydroxylase domain-containing protein [Pseudomonas brassicae]NER60998.1 aspartyl/asparaginyl beta-hydroxylase domain-containing protein [Pseudomonas brassicae]NER64522.1 aspartyl/asparaginyl beta-hydroxylase domain-containing protein [Pseudomonas brassicae]